MNDSQYEAELERRLAIVEDPAYVDPARTELTRTDWTWLFVGSAIVIAAAFVWGYPA